MNTQTTNTLIVANTIAAQIGLRAFFMMGTRHKLGDADSLTFDVRGSAEWNKVKVKLDFGSDTYAVTFYKIGRFEIKAQKDIEWVYAEDLNRVIADETGLALSL